MNNIKMWSACVLIIILQVSLLCAAQVLRAVPEKVEFGTFNTFQIKEITVKLKNTGRKTFLIDKIKANCACIRTSISANEIPPGKTVELKIAARERTGGKFSHDVLIIPKDKERYEPLKILATGTVVQPVSAMIGWEGKKIMEFDPNGPIDLGLVHKSSVRPVIFITADSNHSNLRETIPDVNSFYFELDDYKFEKLPVTGQNKTDEDRNETLVLRLKTKKTLKIGVLRELIKLKLEDDVRLFIPITCRIVGDAFAEEPIIHFGNLYDSESGKCIIHFIDDSKTWKDIKWEAKGYLSNAIVVRKEDGLFSYSPIRLMLDINKSTLNSLPVGYVFCRIKFFQDQSTDEDFVNILLDGFNIKSDDM